MSKEPGRLRVAVVVGVFALGLAGCTGGSGTTGAPRTTQGGTATTAVPTAGTPAQGLGGLIAAGVSTADGSGAVDAYFPDGRRQRITPGELGVPLVRAADANGDSGPPFYVSGPELGFGTALAEADLNGDGRTDLVIGAPGGRLGTVEGDPGPARRKKLERTPRAGDPGAGISGRAWILLNGPGGFTRARMTRVPIPAHVGDQLGSALALTRRSHGGGLDLWVGAQGLTVKGQAQAGVVYRVVVDGHGVPSLKDTVSLASPQVPGSAGFEDHFGQVLATARNGVVVGMPDKTVGSVRYAGEVVRLRTDRATNRLIRADAFTQASPGVFGSVHDQHNFGASISASGLAVGVPRQTVDGQTLAGVVQLFRPSTTRPDSLVPNVAIHQGSPGVPGLAHKNNGFGTSLALGDFACPGTSGLAISAPGDKLDTEPDGRTLEPVPGSLTVVPLPGPATTCPASVLTEGHGLPLVHQGVVEENLQPVTLPGPAGRERLLIGCADLNRGFVWSGGQAPVTTFGPIGATATSLSGFPTALALSPT